LPDLIIAAQAFHDFNASFHEVCKCSGPVLHHTGKDNTGALYSSAGFDEFHLNCDGIVDAAHQDALIMTGTPL